MITGVGQGPTIGPLLLGANGPRCGHVEGVFDHCHARWIGRVVADPGHESGRLVERVVGGCADVGAVGRVGVDPHPISVLDPQAAGIDRVHVKLGIPDTRHPFLRAIRVSEVGVPDPMPVGDGPGRMHRVPGFGGQAHEAKTLFEQRVHGPAHLGPWHLDVADLPAVGVEVVEGYPVILGANPWAGGDDHIRQIGGGFHRLPVDDQVLAVVDGLGQVTVCVHPPRIGVEGEAVLNLLPERDPRIGPVLHQGSTGLSVSSIHDVRDCVSLGGERRRQNSIQVNLGAALAGELEVVGEAPVTGEVTQRPGDAGENRHVVSAVVKRLDSAFPQLEKRIRARSAHLQSLELHPAVGREDDIGKLGGPGPLDLLVDYEIDLGVDVVDEVVGPLRLVDQVGVVVPDHFRGRGHVCPTGEHFSSLRRGVDDQRSIAITPI